MNTQIEDRHYPLRDKTDLIIGAAIEVHKHLGSGFLEIVYKDAFCLEARERDIPYERERYYPVNYKGTLLPHGFNADFVVFGSIILEIKSKNGIATEDIAQTLNYLKCSGCKIGLILNFGKLTLEIKRLVL